MPRTNPAARDQTASDNGVGDLFDRLFRRTGNTANQSRTSSVRVLDPALANPRSEPVIDPALAPRQAHPVVAKLIADIRSRDSANNDRVSTIQIQRDLARPGASTVGVERLLTGDNRPDTVIGDNNTARRPASDSGSSIEITGTGQQNPCSFPQANLSAEEIRLNFNPTTALLLQSHLNFRRGYLEAQAGNNQEAMSLLLDQAVTSHSSLERLIGRDRLLSIAEGWNPYVLRRPRAQHQPPNRRTANLPREQHRHQEYERPREQPAPQGPAEQGQPGLNRRMRRSTNFKQSVFDEVFRVGRTLQGSYQSIEQSRARNQGNWNR